MAQLAPLYPYFTVIPTDAARLYEKLIYGKLSPSQCQEHYSTNGIFLFSECEHRGRQYHLSVDQNADIYLNNWKIGRVPDNLAQNTFFDTAQFVMIKAKQFIVANPHQIFK